MQQYILNNETKSFSKDDIFHITHVMRFNNNDIVRICYENKCFKAKLKINNNNVDYEIINEIKEDKINKNITLLQGNLKGSKLDILIKYATIFGVKDIYISDFKRSVAKLKNFDHKRDRYIKISKEAAELSKRNNIPNISALNNIKDLDYTLYDLVLLADEEEKDNKFKRYINDTYKNILIIIGPEGGIDNSERSYYQKIGAKSITLGNFIYPAEIAIIKLLAAVDID